MQFSRVAESPPYDRPPQSPCCTAFVSRHSREASLDRRNHRIGSWMQPNSWTPAPSRTIGPPHVFDLPDQESDALKTGMDSDARMRPGILGKHPREARRPGITTNDRNQIAPQGIRSAISPTANAHKLPRRDGSWPSKAILRWRRSRQLIAFDAPRQNMLPSTAEAQPIQMPTSKESSEAETYCPPLQDSDAPAAAFMHVHYSDVHGLWHASCQGASST